MFTLLFFISLTIPLIQNLGITILQARNQMKFRSLLYIVIAVVSLVFQIVLAKQYSGLGCAIAIAGALFLGQGLIMNIYYQIKQDLDIISFWKEIGKMSVVPLFIIIVSFFIISFISLNTWLSLGVAIILFSAIYLPLFMHFSMNNYERNLFIAPLINRLRK